MSEVKHLPPPLELKMSLTQVLGRRRSSRAFSSEKLTDTELSTLLWSCAGNSDDQGHRVVPSAMSCREVLAFVIDESGAWIYDPAENTLTKTNEGDFRSQTTLGQDFVAEAPVNIVFASDKKLCGRLVGDRAARCIAIDAGCMLQASQMAATAMGLCSVPRASFDIEKVRSIIHLGDDITPVIAITLGRMP